MQLGSHVLIQGEHRVDLAALIGRAEAEVKALTIRDVPEATGLAALATLTRLERIELPPHMVPTAAPYLRDLPHLAVIEISCGTPAQPSREEADSSRVFGKSARRHAVTAISALTLLLAFSTSRRVSSSRMMKFMMAGIHRYMKLIICSADSGCVSAPPT